MEGAAKARVTALWVGGPLALEEAARARAATAADPEGVAGRVVDPKEAWERAPQAEAAMGVAAERAAVRWVAGWGAAGWGAAEQGMARPESSPWFLSFRQRQCRT